MNGWSLIKNILRQATILAVLLPLWVAASPTIAQITNPATYEKLRQETERKIRNKLDPILLKYCKRSCEVINILVEIEEAVSETEDLGFEGVVGDDLGDNLFVAKVGVEVQIDDQVTAINRERLKEILANNLRGFGTGLEVTFTPVTMPQIGESQAREEQLKRLLGRRMSEAVEKVIARYCPDSCVLAQVAVDGRLQTPDEVADVPSRELMRDKSGRGILRIDNVDIELAMDEQMPETTRQRIVSIVEAKTRFKAPVSLDVQVTPFPESYSRKKAKEQQDSADPFGLAKLRQTLEIFKELAGTKEVITRTTNNSDRTSTSEASKLTASTKDTSTSRKLSSSSNSESAEDDLMTWALVIGGMIVLAGLIIALVMRFAAANRDARMMMEAAGQSPFGQQGQQAGQSAQGLAGNSTLDVNVNRDPTEIDEEARAQMAQRIRVTEIREELVRIFLEAPKVAKETFARLLQEEGVEETAKYVHLFGHLVVFELLNDPNYSRDLYELTEYYHKSDFDFSLEEEVQLLQALKTRVTANEIRVLTRKQMDKFDFLSKLDATQIFNLIQDEKPQLQSIAMTQLDHKRRRAIFEMYEGDAKVDLMRELCRADAIPKEYLTNVAKALHKKVTTRPEFDTENLRSSDILLDLLEKSGLREQRALMTNLMETNADAAKGIKLKLVTVEMLPYLKDGHLLEIIMGLDRQDLLTFLAGSQEHISGLLLSKAPEELAESWAEDLDHVQGIDDQNYRLTEMKILGRIRSLANNGAINLLDINDMIFGTGEESSVVESDEPALNIESPSSMVA